MPGHRTRNTKPLRRRLPVLGGHQMLPFRFYLGTPTKTHQGPCSQATTIPYRHTKQVRHGNSYHQNGRPPMLSKPGHSNLSISTRYQPRDQHTAHKPTKRSRRNCNLQNSKQSSCTTGRRKTGRIVLVIRNTRKRKGRKPPSFHRKPRKSITIRNGYRRTTTRITTFTIRLHRLGPHYPNRSHWKNGIRSRTIYLRWARPKRVHPSGSPNDGRSYYPPRHPRNL